MTARIGSITRELILRMILAAVVLGVIVVAATYLLERQRIAIAIEERASLGVELLRASVRQLALSTGEPWQQVLPQALAGFAKDVPAVELGRFAYVEVLDAEGRPLASIEHDLPAGLVTHAKQNGFKVNAQRVELARIRDSPTPGVVAIAVPVADLAGAWLAQVNGIFVVSPQVLADAQSRLAWAVLTAASIVFVTTLLTYPVIRRLIKGAFLHDVGKIGVRDDIPPGSISIPRYWQFSRPWPATCTHVLATMTMPHGRNSRTSSIATSRAIWAWCWTKSQQGVDQIHRHAKRVGACGLRFP